MHLSPPDFKVIDESEAARIVDYMLDILDQVGLKVEDARMCARLAEAGAEWDGESGVRLGRDLMQGYIDTQRRGHKGGASNAKKREIDFTGTVGGYPLRWVDPSDGAVKRQTLQSTADLVRLADYLPNITAVGTVGVPSDVPPLLAPFFMRLANWRYTTKLSNSYVIWEPRLCPYIVEFCEVVSELEGRGGMGRWFRANNYLVSPLRYARREAEEFMWFFDHGHRCTIGQLSSIGGTTPVTIAGSVGLALAETLAISWIRHVFYGDKGLRLGTVIAPLDMRTAFMPYGRPEQMLATLAQRDVCAYIGTDDEFSFGTACGAKESDFEAGLTKGFSAGAQLALLGKVAWSFGKYSTDEVIDPRMMLIENEEVDAIRRFADGIEVSDRTLPLDAVREVGPGGAFISHPHTVENLRRELWTPRLFAGENFESWRAQGSVSILEKAGREVLEIFERHHPRGINAQTEEKLLDMIVAFAGKLGLDDFKRPVMPK